MKHFNLLIILVTLSSPVLAIDSLSFEALQKGSSSGTVSGDQANKIRAQSHSNNPITMDVKLMYRYIQPGCGRLDYIVKQENVKAKDGSLRPLVLQWQMNLCEDGSPPNSPLIVRK